MLEIGCGNGALFQQLGFHQIERYLGVDFSESMLSEFHARFPDVELVAFDGDNFHSTEKFDLVFSNNRRCWDRTQLDRHVRNASDMLDAHGMIVIAGIPWSRNRIRRCPRRFDWQSATSVAAGNCLDAARELVIKRMGNWYDYADLEDVAAPLNLRLQFRGSLHYPYRMHAILRPPAEIAAAPTIIGLGVSRFSRLKCVILDVEVVAGQDARCLKVLVPVPDQHKWGSSSVEFGVNGRPSAAGGGRLEGLDNHLETEQRSAGDGGVSVPYERCTGPSNPLAWA